MSASVVPMLQGVQMADITQFNSRLATVLAQAQWPGLAWLFCLGILEASCVQWHMFLLFQMRTPHPCCAIDSPKHRFYRTHLTSQYVGKDATQNATSS